MQAFQPLYAGRRQAGRDLGRLLLHLKGARPVVLGVACGGVEVAAQVAEELDSELDVMSIATLPAPGLPELRVGAVCADGIVYLYRPLTEHIGLAALEETIVERLRFARRRQFMLRSGRKPPSLTGRTVILVDDGLSTGMTMMAAIHSVRHRRPQRLIVAVPVASRPGAELVKQSVDEFICPHTPNDFRTVELYYGDFAPLSEQRVCDLLRGR